MYTGILLRSDSHVNYQTTILVDREIALSQVGLGIGIDRGSGVENFWLNYSALSKIGSIATDGVVTVGFKTSNLPITYDSGDLILGISDFTVKGSIFKYSLSWLSVTTDYLTIDDADGLYIQIPLTALEGLKQSPLLSSPTTTTIDIGSSVGLNCVIVDESEVQIGSGSSGVLNLSPAQNIGDRIYAYYTDIHKNKYLRSSILIP